MAYHAKLEKYQSRYMVAFGFFMSLILFNLHVMAADSDDWAEPLKNAQQMLANQQYEKSLLAFKEQADKGNGLAQFNVALFYDLGWGISPQSAIACQWYQKAAKNNIPGAMQALGTCFYNGEGVDKNKRLAYQWYLNAYQQGIAEGACQAGELLLKGDGVELDFEKGLSLCIEAAQQGSVRAQQKLGRWYFDGQYLPQDYQRAFNWLQVVASEKSPSSAFLLAQFYDRGIGMDVDVEQALRWYEVSALGKYQPAYIPTALLYWQAFTKTQAGKDNLLAKSYVWAKISSNGSSLQSEKKISKQLLVQVLNKMPETWRKSLDEKVSAHLAQP